MKYPVVNCLNPLRITNPYTHEVMTVPCGKCRACALSRSQHLTLWCDLESSQNKYTMFVTLTYANRFIPRAQILDSTERPFGRDLVTSDGEILSQADMSDEKLAALLKKFYLFGYVPYLRKEDLQKFLKRFRYYAKKNCSSKVRYFACGEYGPVHFRPHFHLLFFFDDESLVSLCEDFVRASWPFGRVDVQLSSGSASSYVAGYVNSYCNLPELFKSPAVRPFVVHSQRLGCRFLQSERSKVYEMPAKDFIRRCVTLNGKYREFDLWRSYYAYFYPKCKGFGEKSLSSLYETYTLYATARNVFPECHTCLDTAKAIAELCSIFYFKDSERTFTLSSLGRDELTLCRYFCDSFEFTENLDLCSSAGQKWIFRIYNELLLSKHFLNFVCDNFNWTQLHIMSKIKLIKEFYSQLDYLHLVEFFESQCMFFDSNLYGPDDLLDYADNSKALSDSDHNFFFPYFYDNLCYNISDYKATPAFNLMSAQTDKLFHDRIKHKYLNDLNRIFED